MEKLTLTPNRPEVIALAFTEGKPVSSNFGGNQIMYTLTDGRRWFADPEAAAKVDALNLGRGEPCEVTMCVDRTKKKTYEARYLAPDAPAPVVAQVGIRTSGHAEMSAANAQTAARPSVASTQPSDNRAAQEVSQPAQQYSNPSPSTSGGKLMACFLVAVDTAIETEAYAKRKGLNIQFTAEDLRAIANTLYISESRAR